MAHNLKAGAIAMLTTDEILAYADELGIPREQITDDVIELVKRKVSLGLQYHWPVVMKDIFKEAIECPLGLVCYPSCAWWENGKCTFLRKNK